jgi:hypothetical protein
LLDCLSAATNQRFNQLLLQGYQPLQDHWRDFCNGPYQDTGLWGPHLRTYYTPCQQEVARGPNLCPSTQPFLNSKQKMGEWYNSFCRHFATRIHFATSTRSHFVTSQQ